MEQQISIFFPSFSLSLSNQSKTEILKRDNGKIWQVNAYKNNFIEGVWLKFTF